MLNNFNGYTEIKDNLINHDIGIWNSNGDIDALEDLKNINFKDYEGYTWNGFVSVKKEDSFNLGLINKEDYYKFSKSIIPKLIMNSGFDINNFKWYACLHLDSEKNYNIHFFLMEIKKTKFNKSDRLIPKSAIKKFKSNALSYLINRDEIMSLKENLFMGIIKDVRNNNLTSINKKSNLDNKIGSLYKKLPRKHRLQYNSPNLNENRALLDEIIASILSSPKVVNNYYNYLKILHDIDFDIKEYYGESSYNNYVDNQIKKLYSKIGNEILSQYKGYNSENYLSSQKEFLSKNIFKLNLKTSNNITEQKQLQLGESLYNIAKYYDLKNNQTKRIIKNWYYRSGFSNSFESYYKSVITSNIKVLTSNEFIKAFEELGLSKSKYNKLKDNYYKQKRISNYLMECAIKYIQYEEERLDKERESEYDKEIYY
ncbi:MAG: hypothetical protein PHE54_02960 [Bacilli bacterium]|nr:hypothetical protein [Bacilli bacterium]